MHQKPHSKGTGGAYSASKQLKYNNENKDNHAVSGLGLHSGMTRGGVAGGRHSPGEGNRVLTRREFIS